ncbi:MAG: gephyrin-like molybdotransferase Glp [Cyanobacteria bacterium P01_F01_bin.42]
MLSVTDAFEIILDSVRPLSASHDIQQIEFQSSLGRILAQDIRGLMDFPYWDNSAMDGYAIAAQDLERWSHTEGLTLDVVMNIPAGVEPSQKLQAGQAARIFTGAMLPEGADTIVMQEHTERVAAQRIKILEAPKPHAFVREHGSYYEAGAILLDAGIEISAPDLAVLATMQCTEISVFRKPIVALVSTGNELVAPGESLNPGQIVDSNRCVLAALLEQAGATAIHLRSTGDTLVAVKQAITEAIEQADIVISTGGVSVGDYDFVDQALKELGGDIHFQKVAVKPGKPLTFATFDQASKRVLYFGLPGNPVSAPVGFWRFVQPALRKFSGRRSNFGPTFIPARSLQSLGSNGQRETYVWGNLRWESNGAVFQTASGSQISGNLINLAQTNGLGILSCDRPCISAGEVFPVMMI